MEISEDKIILLDLNYTLISNSRECHKRYPERIYEQKYEEELIDLVKNNYVILITARPEKYKDQTLNHIKDLTGFTPDESFWNIGMTPPKLKEYWLKKSIFPSHGEETNQYLAIESNPKTRAMYKEYAIEAYPKSKFI